MRLQAGLQPANSETAHEFLVDTDGSQRRPQLSAEVDIVETDHAQFAGNMNVEFAASLKHVGGRHVIGSNDGRWAVGSG